MACKLLLSIPMNSSVRHERKKDIWEFVLDTQAVANQEPPLISSAPKFSYVMGLKRCSVTLCPKASSHDCAQLDAISAERGREFHEHSLPNAIGIQADLKHPELSFQAR